MVVDTKETSRAVVNIVTKTDNVNGEIAVTEIVKNLHQERSQYRFVKMVEVDADSDIRSNIRWASKVTQKDGVFFCPNSQFDQAFHTDSAVKRPS